MANYCSNVITVTGPDLVITRLVKSICGLGMHNHFSFNRIVPIPDFVLVDPTQLRKVWEQRRWGTTQQAWEQKLPERSVGKVIYRFTTLWTHPEQVMQEIASMFPDLQFDAVAIEEHDESAMVATYHGNDMTWRPVEIGSEEHLTLHWFVYNCELNRGN